MYTKKEQNSEIGASRENDKKATTIQTRNSQWPSRAPFPSKSGIWPKPSTMRCVLGVVTIVVWGWSLADQHPWRYHGKSAIFGWLSAFGGKVWMILRGLTRKSYADLGFCHLLCNFIIGRRGYRSAAWVALQAFYTFEQYSQGTLPYYPYAYNFSVAVLGRI